MLLSVLVALLLFTASAVEGVSSFSTHSGAMRVLRSSSADKTCTNTHGHTKHRLQPLSAELRLLIHGTKNAFTTARTGDVLSYKLDEEREGKAVRLGALTEDGQLLPLCNRIPQGAEFFADPTTPALSAEELKKQGKLLRIVSSDRRGDAFVIEEYLDEDILVPVIAEDAHKASTDDIHHDITLSLVEQEVELAQKKLALLREQQQQQQQRGKGLQAVKSDAAPPPVGPYSQAIKAGSMLYTSGCIGLHASTGKLVEGGIEAETLQALKNLQAILQASGSDLTKIAKTTIFVTNMKEYAIVNRIYADFLKNNPVFPARTTVEVAGLPLGALVEIEAVALL